jgi:hypothetical protein
MNKLSKNIRWLCFFVFFVFNLAHIIANTEAMTTYLFSRCMETQQLSLIDIVQREPGAFDPNNPICAQLPQFRTPRMPWIDYRVIEYKDYMGQADLSLYNLVENSKFLVLDSKEYNWYVSSPESDIFVPLLNVSQYEAEKQNWSSVCYTDTYIFVQDASDKLSYTIMVLAGLGCFLALVAASLYILYCCSEKNCTSNCFWMFHTFWMLCFGCISAATLFVLTARFGVDGSFMIPVAIHAYWCITFLELYILFLRITQKVRDDPIPDLEDTSMVSAQGKIQLSYMSHRWPNSNSKIVPVILKDLFMNRFKKTIGILLCVFMFFLIIGVYNLYTTGILGPDNTSPYTGYFFLNTLVGPFDSIRSNIRIM